MSLRIGEVAEITGCQVVTIRYYEKRGLLGPPARSGGNLRIYQERDVRRLKLIRLCRENDMPLADIKILLSLTEVDSSDLEPDQEFFARCIQKIDGRLESLKKLKAFLRHLNPGLNVGDKGKCQNHHFHQASVEFCERCHISRARENAQ